MILRSHYGKSQTGRIRPGIRKRAAQTKFIFITRYEPRIVASAPAAGLRHDNKGACQAMDSNAASGRLKTRLPAGSETDAETGATGRESGPESSLESGVESGVESGPKTGAGKGLGIGVVGGGASAVCLLDELAESDAAPGSVTVFEPASRLWRGRPYQSDLPSVRVNIPPDGMSIRFGDKEHFSRWLIERDLAFGSEESYEDPISGMRFVPRALFGRYLEQSALEALVRLRERGWRVRVLREQVAAAAPAPGGITLRTDRGQRITVNCAVLCVGRDSPEDEYALAGTPGFVPDPYPLARSLDGIDPEDRVGVIGSGLTGTDVVLSLAARGHRGGMRLLSRSGVLPLVRQKASPYTLRHFTPERFREAAAEGAVVTLDDLVETMEAEFEEAGEDIGAVVAEIAAFRDDPVTRLRRHLAAVDSPGKALRIIQHAVPATGPDVWPLLPERDKEYLLAAHYRTVMSLCCPMPPASAAALLGLIDSGQLEIVPGVQRIEPASGGGFTVHTAGEHTHRTDVLVNALSTSRRGIPAQAVPLVTSLTGAGLAERHPRGGVRVERATSRLVVDGRVETRLYALGDLAAGSLFFTFGLPSIVDRAHDIVAAITGHAGAARSTLIDDALQTA